MSDGPLRRAGRRLAGLTPVSRRRHSRDLQAQQAELARLSSHIEAADRWIGDTDVWRRALEADPAGPERGFDKRLDTPGLVLETLEDDRAGRVLGYSSSEPQAAGQAGFADAFRGSEDRIKDLQRPYLELLRGREPVLDLGCGRGEMLDLLREQGLSGFGVDADAEMVERGRRNGNRVELGDAAEFLERQEPGTLGAVFSAQLIEHLGPDQLNHLLGLARRALQPNGVLIAETLNPHVPEALRNFWADPTHRQPLFPETMLVLCRAAGFRSAFIFHPDAGGDPDADLLTKPVYAVVGKPGGAS